MTKPVVGVIGNTHVINDRHLVQAVGQRNMRAIAEVAGALPLMFAGTPDVTDIDALLEAVDGILLTGARANVHPTHFGVEPDPRHEPYDQDRDAMALGLIRTCVARGVPIFGITNFGAEFWPPFRERWPVFDHFRDVVVSGVEKLAKPDPAIYALAEQRFGLPGSAMLFVDDNADNIASARDCGWHVHHFTDSALLRADLAARGLIG